MSSGLTESRKDVQGCQEPRIKRVPPYEYTDGEDCAYLASNYGLTPDPWQRNILDSWLGRDKNDKYTAKRCGVLVPRQNGKNAIIEMRELYGLCAIGETILHTAHEVKTAQTAFRRLCSFFENPREYPELSNMVLRIRRTNGQEAIELDNGGSIAFSARSRGAARGFTVDVVVCDEVQELKDEQLEALMPTMSAAPLDNPQLIFTGTPPNHNAVGEVFGRMRKNAHENTDKGLSWFEWSVKEVGDISDRDRWAACNPALGIRLNIETIESELEQMSEDGFARERLSMWFDMAGAKVVQQSEWDKLKVEKSPEDGKIAYGIKFSPDGAYVSLAVALRPEEGKTHIELIEHKSMSEGVSWLADWLVPRMKKASCVVIDGMQASFTLAEMLRERGVKAKGAVILPRASDVVTASSMMLNAIREEEITHYDQPALNVSILGSERRNVGTNGGWAFGSRNGDSSPAEAVTLALWAIKTSKRNPNRKQRLI